MAHLYYLTIYRSQTFAGRFPPPFDKMAKKGIRAYSRYNTQRTPTNLHAPTMKALLGYCRSLLDEGTCAIGSDGGETLFAEYTRETGTGETYTDILRWDTNAELLRAKRYNHETGQYEPYSVRTTYGTPVFFLLIYYSIQKDREFADTFETFKAHYSLSFSNGESALHTAAVLQDNIYRRMLNGDIPIAIPNDGEIEALDVGAASVTDVVIGTFAHLKTVKKRGRASWKPPAFSEFAGAYRFSDRRLKKSEIAMIPQGMEGYYVVSEPVVQLCRHIKETTDWKAPMRNILLRGPSGTGKTDCARAVAVGTRLPYLFTTCNTHTELLDLTGAIIPRTGGSKPVTAEELRQALHLPADDELKIAPAYYYREMAGFEKEGATFEDCLQLKQQRIRAYQETLLRQSNGYEFVYGELIRAVKNGYIFELQEPSVIVQEGVLTGLNGLLDQSAHITLPTGETVKRHKDTVIILTTNPAYAGCKPLNQSVLSRMHLIMDIALPPDSELAQRIANRTGFTDQPLLMKMIATVHQIDDYCRENSITDGVVGMRELEQWVMSYMVTGDFMRAAEMTVLASCTADLEDQKEIREIFLETQYEMGCIAA